MEISPHFNGKIKPLCKATERLLQSCDLLAEQDLLHIGIKDGRTVDSPRTFVMHAVSALEDPDCWSIPSRFARTDWWKRIPGAEYYAPATQNITGCTAPITDTTALCTIAVWGTNRLRYSDELTKLEFLTRYGDFIKSTVTAEWQAQFKEDHSIPEHAPLGNPNKLLMPHQRVASACANHNESYALFMEQRTGKTPTCISTMDTDCETTPHAMNIVVCPKNVRSNWANELKVFTTKHINIVVIRGSKIRRIKSLLTAFEYRGDYDYTVVIISYEGVSKTKNAVCTFKWRWGVIDESHYIKAAHTDRWQAIRKLRDMCQRRIACTGTPICNHAFDLWTQLEWLGEGCSGFTSQDAFRKFYGNWVPAGRGYERLVGMQNVPLLQERLARYAFMAKRVEVLPDMPKGTNTIRECEMTPEQAEVYKRVSEQLYTEIDRELEEADESKASMTVTNILTKLLRLSQLTAGFAVLDGEIDPETGEPVGDPVIDRFDPNPKIEELIEYVKERPDNSKVLVWSWWVLPIKQIRARLEQEGIKCVTYYGRTRESDRDAVVHQFNNDLDTKVFIGNPAAGGVGLDLSGRCLDADGNQRTQADSIVYFSQNWSSSVRSQSGARPLHKDIKWPVETVDLCVVDSIDFDILSRVLSKQQHAMKIQDIRDLLKGLLKR